MKKKKKRGDEVRLFLILEFIFFLTFFPGGRAVTAEKEDISGIYFKKEMVWLSSLFHFFKEEGKREKCCWNDLYFVSTS